MKLFLTDALVLSENKLSPFGSNKAMPLTQTWHALINWLLAVFCWIFALQNAVKYREIQFLVWAEDAADKLVLFWLENVSWLSADNTVTHDL